MRGAKFNANIRYKILCINSKGITIENIKDKKKYTLTEELLNKHFRYGYCATAHSCQGASINNNITIHEWDKSYLVSREWLWCSLTRARDFNKIAFFKSDKANERMEKTTTDKLLEEQDRRIQKTRPKGVKGVE